MWLSSRASWVLVCSCSFRPAISCWCACAATSACSCRAICTRPPPPDPPQVPHPDSILSQQLAGEPERSVYKATHRLSHRTYTDCTLVNTQRTGGKRPTGHKALALGVH
eukprot:3752825-Pyramimonas_sp.AAC.3